MKIKSGSNVIKIYVKQHLVKVPGDEPPIRDAKIGMGRIGYSKIASRIADESVPYGLTNRTNTNKCKTN